MPLLGKNILVVEDEFLIAADISDAIESARGTVGQLVTTVREAHEALSSRKFDGAVLDLKLLNGSALSVAQRLARDGVPYVLLTGYDRDGVPGLLRAAPRLEKPFRRDDLIKIATRLFRDP